MTVNEEITSVDLVTKQIEDKETALAQLKKISTKKKTKQQRGEVTTLNHDVQALRESHLAGMQKLANRFIKDPNAANQITDAMKVVKNAEKWGGKLPPLEVSHTKQNGEKVYKPLSFEDTHMLKKRVLFHNSSTNKKRERDEYMAAVKTKVTELIVFGLKDESEELQDAVVKATRLFSNPEKGKAQLKLNNFAKNKKANDKANEKAKKAGFRDTKHFYREMREGNMDDEKKKAAESVGLGVKADAKAKKAGFESVEHYHKEKGTDGKKKAWLAADDMIAGITWAERYKQANRLRKLMVRCDPNIDCLPRAP